MLPGARLTGAELTTNNESLLADDRYNTTVGSYAVRKIHRKGRLKINNRTIDAWTAQMEADSAL